MTLAERTNSDALQSDSQANPSVCVIITTYEPADNLGSLISATILQVGRVFLINDSGSPQIRDRLDVEFSKVPNLVIHHMASNCGIAAALNCGLEAASSLGFSKAVLLDDDTRITSDLVASLLRFWLQLEVEGQQPGVVGVSRSEVPLNPGGDGEIRDELEWHRVRDVITAGSMVDIECARDLGGFREEFIIDAVDHEFCARVRQRGLLVAKLAKPLIEQPVGCVRTVTVAGVNFSTTNHSPTRRYYMYRNNLVFAREQLFDDPLLSMAIIWFLFKTMFLIVCMEDQRREKLAAIFRGILDGVRRRGGHIGSGDHSEKII